MSGAAAGDASRAQIRHRISAAPPPLRERLAELLGARDLYILLVGRELRTRYKQTALGVIWVVLQPLVPAVIFGIVFGTFAGLPSAGAPYFLFALSGLVLFGLFSAAVSRAGTAFIRDGQLVTKVYFPRAILPLAGGSSALVDFAVGLAVVLVLMALTGHVPSLAVVTIPLIAVWMLAVGLGLGLGLSALSAHYRDFALAIPFVLQVLLYASPVVYSAELVPPSLQALYWLNPLVAPIGAFRSVLLGTMAPAGGQIALSLLTGAAVVAIGILVFSRVSRDLADII
jgi:lipopolysaccharide transport system permease protein